MTTAIIAILYITTGAMLLCLGIIVGAKKRQSVITLMRIAQFAMHYPSLVRTNQGLRNKNYVAAWNKTSPLIWAHAGGADPVLYGNSMENFDRAIAKGFRCLEADVGMTSDNIPVLTHLFRPNNENLYEGKPSVEKFKNTKINDKYTPLTLDMFIERYRSFDGWIFLDGLTFSKNTMFDFRRYFAKVDEDFKRKIIVQVVKFADLLSLKRNNPFGGIHFSGIFGVGTNKYVRPLLIKALKACGVKSVSISDFEVSGRDISEVIQDFRRNDMVVSVAGVNTLSYYKRLRKIGVNCIDSDYLTPADIQGIE